MASFSVVVLHILMGFVSFASGQAIVYTVNSANLPSLASFQSAIVAGLWNKNMRTQPFATDIGKYDTMFINRNGEDIPWLHTSFDYYTEITSSSPPTILTVSPTDIITLAINNSIIKNRVLFSESESFSIPTVIMLCNEYNALPITNASEFNNFNLPIIYNSIGKWQNELSATSFSFNRYLNASNAPPMKLNVTIMALQKPGLLTQGYLTDFIIANNLFVLWMSNLCIFVDNPENDLYEQIVLSPYYTTNQNIGLSIMGYYPNDEVLATCSPKSHSQISFVSDFVMSLSFHQLLPSIVEYVPYKYLEQIPYRKNMTYDANKAYLALIQSDGDNIQLDMNGLRPRMEERMGLCSPNNRSNNVCPLFSWTISNRLIDLAPHIIYWFYNMSNTVTMVDSFLMGPSGYGYLYPSQIMPETLQNAFVMDTILDAYLCGEMQGAMYWDYTGTPKEMQDYLIKFDNYNYSSIDNGIINDTDFKFVGMFSQSPVIDSYVGDAVVTFELSYHWGSGTPPEIVAKALNNELKKGSLTYLYKIWDVTFYEVEQMVKLLNDDIVLVDYREMIALAYDKRKQKS